jgi:hypothetical protein
MKAIVIAARQPIPEPSRNPSDAAQYSSTKPQGGGLSPISAPLHHFLRLAPVSLSPQTPCRIGIGRRQLEGAMPGAPIFR